MAGEAEAGSDGGVAAMIVISAVGDEVGAGAAITEGETAAETAIVEGGMTATDGVADALGVLVLVLILDRAAGRPAGKHGGRKGKQTTRIGTCQRRACQ